MKGDGSTVDIQVNSDSDSSDLGELPTEKYRQKNVCDFRDIRNSRIDELNLEKCKVLDIRDSWVRSLHAEHLACLVKLLADFSQLASLDTGPLQRLKKLSLQGCPIEELQTAGLSQLTLLNVSSTKIRALELGRMSQLEGLAIENTEIELSENADLSRLRYLNVAGTKLETLNTMQLKKLRNLNMNNCKIKALDTTYLKLLKKLLIGTSQLSQLDLAPMPQLHSLFVGKTCLTALDTNQARKLQTGLKYYMLYTQVLIFTPFLNQKLFCRIQTAKLKMSCTVPNCAKCPDDVDKCTDCEKGYSLMFDECQKTNCDYDNCTACTREQYYCSDCIPGYMVANGKCYQQCPDESVHCGNKELCSEDKQCQPCPRGMFNIDGGCFCSKGVACDTGMYCNARVCTACSNLLQNCEECSQTSTCYQCSPGYDLVDGKCIQRCGGTVCGGNEICVGGECQKCKGSNVNIGGECKCRQTQDFCPAGFYCGDKGCQECSYWMPNCLVCTADHECVEQRNPCDDWNCASCESYPSSCTACNPGYRLLSTSCSAKCEESSVCSRWQICDAENHCQDCPYDMRDKAGVCMCGSETCTDGQICSITTNKCQQCSLNMPNCRNCSGVTTCTELFSPCADANCAMCEMTAETCSKCATGYKLIDSRCRQTCGGSQCPENEVCVDGACKICALNEGNVAGACSCGLAGHCPQKTYCAPEGKCQACSPGCRICNGAACYACEPGYFLGEQGCWKRNKTAIIAGSVAGGVVFLLLIAGVVYYFLKYRRQREYAMQKAAQPTASQIAEIQQDQMYI